MEIEGVLKKTIETERSQLRGIIKVNNIKRIRNEPFEATDKFVLGQALFFDPILSTNKDISCSTCHLLKRGTSDFLEKSIGTGGEGLAENRISGNMSKRHERNSLALWDLDNESVKNLFWDGRIEVLDSKKIIYRTPLKELLYKNIENALAAQALFPIVNEGEMFDTNCKLETKDQQSCLNIINILPKSERHLWISTYHIFILDRLLGHITNKELTQVQIKYRKLFENAYKDINLRNMDFGLVGNAIAHFEEVAFATRDTKWDLYIEGDEEALADNQVKGALLFFRKYKCNTCHSGPIFSDFNFHSLGIVNEFSDEGRGLLDKGRGDVTGKYLDDFKFRTPPLRNVTLTAPYMHDGSIASVKGAIQRHFIGCKENIVLSNFCNTYEAPSSLAEIRDIEDQNLDYLLDFFRAIEDDGKKRWNEIVPSGVPSGMKIDEVMTN